jgi:hypothetical protein
MRRWSLNKLPSEKWHDASVNVSRLMFNRLGRELFKFTFLGFKQPMASLKIKLRRY